MRLSFEEIVRAVDGSAVAGAAPCGIVEGVGTDSRAVKPGSLFVCIPGETLGQLHEKRFLEERHGKAGHRV